MTKSELINCIITQLNQDLEVLLNAARNAHKAATHEENIPDNKYDTLALEASYVAQGQANRAQGIRGALEAYRQLQLPPPGNLAIKLASLVTLEDEEGVEKLVFLGPAAGGLKIPSPEGEIVVITPASPLGRELLGKSAGDSIEVETEATRTEYEIIRVI